MKQSKKRVAIIDDGIYKCQETQLFVKEFLEFNPNKKNFRTQYSDIERFSHGTCCAMIIQKYYSEVEIVSLKILCQEGLYGSFEGLFQALKWCKNNGIDVVSMSLGTTNICDFRAIQNIVNELIDDDIIIVAAVCNEFHFTLPALLDNVIGVASITEKEYNESELAFLGINALAKSVHDVTIENEEYTTSDCNSYATPYVAANLLNGLIDLEKNISYVNDIIWISDYSCCQVRDGKVFINLAELKVSFTCNKKEYIALGIAGKSIDDAGFIELLVKKNIPIAIIDEISTIRKRDMSKMSHLIGCDIMIYETKEAAKNADYVIIYNNSSVIIKKRVLWFWIEVATINENQIVEVLLNEIYGG